MKKFLFVLFIFISVISFGSVKIINGKNTNEKSIIYKDNTCTLQLDYKDFDCVGITINTSSFASEIEKEVGFMIDSGYNRTLSYKIQKDKKTITCSADSAIDAAIIKNIVYDMEKGYLLMIDYVDKNDKLVARNIKLAEIKKAIAELKASQLKK
jgi:hypothetical protein|nr:MAG TPA: hypothetical protein [Caudoviricetes sp.]